MNFHPIFVHFPIALLTVYAIFEMVWLKKITDQPYWFYIKAVLLICGTAGAFMAFATGDIARFAVVSGSDGLTHLVPNVRQVISLHKSWAAITVAIFSFLTGGYVVAWLNRLNFSVFLPPSLKQLWSLATVIEKVLIGTKLVIVLALFGLISVTVTGALGGSIVYGPNADPVVQFIYKLLVK